MMEELNSDEVDNSRNEYKVKVLGIEKGKVKIWSKQKNTRIVESKKKEERWKPDEIEKFLELYELFPCLWDYKVPQYKDRNAKENAWGEIVKLMNKKDLTVKKVKDKIRVLRNTYSNELVKIQKSKSYTPILRWFNTMHRVVGQVVQSRGNQSVALSEEKPSLSQLDEDEEELDETEMQRIGDTVDPLSHVTIPRGLPETSKTKQTHPYVRPLSKRVSEQGLNKIETAVDELKVISNQVFSHASSNVETHCEFDMFSKLVSTQLKKLPEFEALAAMQEIQSCLIRRRMACANRSGRIVQEPPWDDGAYNTNSSVSSPSVQEDSITELEDKDLTCSKIPIFYDQQSGYSFSLKTVPI